MRPIVHRLVVASLCGTLLWLAACSSPEERAQKLVARAQEYAAQDKPKEALLELRRALKLQPRSADLNFKIAETLQEQAEYSEAIYFYREAARLDPSRTDAVMAEVKLILHDDTKRAEELVNEALQREPQNPLVHLRRAEVALVRANTGEALAAAMTAMELDPKDGIYPMTLGIVNQARIREARLHGGKAGDDLFQQALDAFTKADDLYVGSTYVRIQRGKVYATWGGHAKEAGEAFRAAVEIANQKGSAKERRDAAKAAVDWGNVSGDRTFLEWALAQRLAADETNLDYWMELAQIHDARDGSGEALLKQLLEKRPEDIDAHIRYANYLVSKDQADAAVAWLEGIAAKGVEPARALEDVGRIQIVRGRNDAARAVVERLQREHADNGRTQLAAARLALAENRPDDAVKALERTTPESQGGEGQRLLAMAELRRENLPAATLAIKRAIEAPGGATTEALLLKARIHHAARDWALTIVTFQQLLRSGVQLGPTDRLLAARALYESGRPDVGRQLLEAALANPAAPSLVAVEFANREGAKDPAAARKWLTAALGKAPSDASVIEALCQLDLREGQGARAVERVDKAVAENNATPGLLLLRARVYASQGQLERAEQDATRAFEAAPDLPGASQVLLGIYTARGKLDQAVKSFVQADRAGVLNAGSRMLLGNLYLRRGELDRAKAMYEKALAERPDLPRAKNDLAYILASQGVDLERALTLAQEAQQAQPEDPNIADTLGFVYLKKSMHEPAMQQFRFATESAEATGASAPDYPYHLGLALRALGRNEEAVAAFEKALALDPNFQDAQSARQELDAARTAAKAAPSS
jgi:tetratricopeptide (TPR) repeat protein